MAAGVINLIFSLALIAVGFAEESTLLNVIQVYRHGLRTPVGFYENDPYQDSSYWRYLTTGQLTNEGKRQHYELGQFTRRRYKDFLPARYDRADFLVQTTPVDRTHMSAASQIAGLYPPAGDQIWNKYIKWQPIPIFTSETAVMGTLSSCTKYTNLKSELSTTEEFFIKLNEEYGEVYEYLKNNSGTNVNSLNGAFIIYDALHIEEIYNYALPAWTRSVYPQPLKYLYDTTFLTHAFTDELKILSTGPFLNAIIEQFDGYLEGTSTYKYLQFSAHDNNIAAILNTLGSFDPVVAPNFASTLYFEFRERNGTNFINLYYKNYGDPEEITIPGCDFDCNWVDFKSIVSNYTITTDEWDELCNS